MLNKLKNGLIVNLGIFIMILNILVSPIQAYEYMGDDVSIDDSVSASELEDVDGEISELTVELGDSESEISTNGISLPNKLILSLTPQADGFDLRVKNVGIDAVSRISINIRIYTYGGDFVTAKTISDTNAKPGTTKYTWKIEKAKTVQETVKWSGFAEDGDERITLPLGTTYRYNFVGGAFGSMKAYEGERHHIPSKSVNGLSESSGPAIRMLKEDHKNTASWGKTSDAVKYRETEKKLVQQGKFDEAMQMGVDDIRKNFGTKYDKAIDQMIDYAERKGYIEPGSVK